MKTMTNGKRFTQTGTMTSDRLAGQMLKNGEEKMKAFLAEKFPEIYGTPAVEKKTTDTKSKVCVIANRLVRTGLTKSEAFRKAWAIVKASTVETKVSGVTYGKRQTALEHLTRYDVSDISVNLARESANEYDNNAIAVVVSVQDKGSYTVGYLPRMIAATIAPLIDAGKAVRATFKEVRGKYQSWHNYGLAVSVSI